MGVLLVDVANVVGARPDGWWRDRAAATGRLLARLPGLVGRTVSGPDGGPWACTALVAVVEGAARDVDAPPGLELLRAPGSGDDALARRAAELVRQGEMPLVVTADRGHRARLPEGTSVVGPRWLLDRLAALEAEGSTGRMRPGLPR